MILELSKNSLSLFEDKYHRLVRKAKVFGIEAPTYKIKETKLVERNSGKPFFMEYQQEVVVIEFENIDVVLNDWKVVASIRILNTNDVKNSGIYHSFEPIPDYLYQRNPTECDHCGKSTYRTHLFILKHKNGEYKQVGSTCLKDFTKCENVENIIKFLTLLEDFESTNWTNTDEKSGKKWYSVKDLLSLSIFIIDKLGWVSHAEHNKHGTKTTANVLRDLVNNRFEGCNSSMSLLKDLVIKDDILDDVNVQPKNDMRSIALQNCEKSQQIIDWFKTVLVDAKENEFIMNVGKIVQANVIDDDGSNFGMICYAVKYYNEMTSGKYDGDFLGKIGQILEGRGELVGKREVQTRYGKSIMAFIKVGENTVKLFSTSNSKSGIKLWNTPRGETIVFSGVIKHHNVYKNTKYTELTRVIVY